MKLNCQITIEPLMSFTLPTLTILTYNLPCINSIVLLRAILFLACICFFIISASSSQTRSTIIIVSASCHNRLLSFYFIPVPFLVAPIGLASS